MIFYPFVIAVVINASEKLACLVNLFCSLDLLLLLSLFLISLNSEPIDDDDEDDGDNF